MGMFVRKLRNRSGSVSVQIISKKKGRYKVMETVGTSRIPEKIAQYVIEAKNRINHPDEQTELFPSIMGNDIVIKSFLENMSNLQVHVVGPELIFGALFDRIGFNAIEDEMFRHITITRLAYPVSKLKTVDYLRRYKGIDVSVSTIYRFLDNLNDKYKEEVEKIAYQYTKSRLGTIRVVFYDMTSLYFEAEDEDDLRKMGFSKDGKFQHPQILLGLLVGEKGLPIGYDIFEGNTFEGHTLLPVLEKFQAKYGFKKPVVIADAALLSRQNLETLQKEGYGFIVGARIKGESEEVKREILQRAKNIKDGEGFVIKKSDGWRLVVTYSDKRAEKDAYNRRRGVKNLRRRIRSGRLTKQSINNRGYNKFLTIQGEASIFIDEEKIKADEQWDGLKGYVTNTRFSVQKVADNYVHLWQIEKAFRISKTDLRVRPIYHYRRRRIEAHICIAFAAYTIYKELEYLLKQQGVLMSPKRAAELTHTMYELEYTLPQSKKKEKMLLKMDEEQQMLYNAIYR